MSSAGNTGDHELHGSSEMTIRVSSTFASSATELAAFDRALGHLGVGDVNVIHLSSVVPAGAVVELGKVSRDTLTVGDKLYAVLAEERCSVAGQEAWAGLAWVTDQSGQGGLFVEANDDSEEKVQEYLSTTIEAMMEDRAARWDFGDINYEIVGGVCDGEPVCALAFAVFEDESWSRGS